MTTVASSCTTFGWNSSVKLSIVLRPKIQYLIAMLTLSVGICFSWLHTHRQGNPLTHLMAQQDYPANKIQQDTIDLTVR